MNSSRPGSAVASEAGSSAVLFISFAAMPKDSDAAVALQRAVGQRRATQAGLRIVHEVIEMGVSAMRSKNRLAIPALLNYFEDHPDVRHVIVPGIHRLSRNHKEFSAILQRFQAMGITIMTFAGDVVSLDDTHGDLAGRVAQSMAGPHHRLSVQTEAQRRKALQDNRASTGGAV